MRNIFKLNFRKKTFLAGIIGTCLAIPVFLIFITYEEKSYLIQESQFNAIKLAQLVSEQSLPYLQTKDEPGIKQLLSNLVKQRDVLCAYIAYDNKMYSEGDFKLVKPGYKIGKSEIVTFMGKEGLKVSQAVKIPTRSEGTGEDFQNLTSPSVSSGHVTVILSIASIDAHINHLWKYEGSSLILILGIGMMIGWVATGRASKPLERTAERAKSFLSQNHGIQEVAPASQTLNTNDESIIISEAFKYLTIEYDRTKKQMESLIRTASGGSGHWKDTFQKDQHNFHLQIYHDIRTPLGELMMIVNDLADRELPAGFPPENLQRMTQICDYIKKLISMRMELEKIEKGVLTFDKENIPIKDIFETVITDSSSQIRGKNVNCSIELLPGDLSVYVNSQWFPQVILNILQNAVKHSPIGSKVKLSARENETTVIISIKDSGNGVPAQNLPRLLSSPISKTDGNGMGLHLCNYFVKLHNGTMWFNTRAGRGTTFYISVPKMNDLKEKQPLLL